MFIDISTYIFQDIYDRATPPATTTGMMTSIALIIPPNPLDPYSVPLLISSKGIYDRARPPAMTTGMMISIALIIQFSLTHGYLPYGSSDVLLPSLIFGCWSLELLPRYDKVDVHLDRF